MKKLLAIMLVGGLLSSLAVLAQNQPPAPSRDRQTPPQFSQQERQRHEMMQHQLELQRQHHMQVNPPGCPLRHSRPLMGMLLLGCVVIHILLAIWVYQDIRRRNAGSGIWIIITLLAGLCGAAVYALVRIGEKQG